jgi:uncharacterized membrane protein YeaQ/YmgE (transglycosylase-associated protein family)
MRGRHVQIGTPGRDDAYIFEDGRNAMSIIGWIFLGLIAGYLASKLVNKEGEGLLLDIALGIGGAIVGGFFFTWMGMAGVTGFNLYSMLVALVGAVALLVVYHAVVHRRVSA